MSDGPVGKTKHTELTLDQIASLQPGLGRLMPEVSNRYWICYYAARGGNWALAAYQLNELAGLLRQGALTRPQYARQLTAFQDTHITALLTAISAQDFDAFERQFHKATEAANVYHRATGHPEIIWRLPAHPPEHLDLAAQSGPSFEA